MSTYLNGAGPHGQGRTGRGRRVRRGRGPRGTVDNNDATTATRRELCQTGSRPCADIAAANRTARPVWGAYTLNCSGGDATLARCIYDTAARVKAQGRSAERFACGGFVSARRRRRPGCRRRRGRLSDGDGGRCSTTETATRWAAAASKRAERKRNDVAYGSRA